MDSPDQRRPKRRRVLNQTSPYVSLSSAFVGFSFLTFLYVILFTGLFTSTPFKPVLVVSRMPLLASSRSVMDKSIRGFRNFSLPLRLESWVLFPDHVLFLVLKNKKNGFDSDELECVYYGGKNGQKGRAVRSRVISVDEYDDFRTIVRCPAPPLHDFGVVNLRQRRKYGSLLQTKNMSWPMGDDTKIPTWDNVVYEAVSEDDDTVVVFAKGLKLRPGRESDPAPFTCHFGWGHSGNFTVETKALTAAQEVVRCPLPSSFDRNQVIRVTIGVSSLARARRHGQGQVLLPSVAKIFSSGNNDDKKISSSMGSTKKYNLCACTMLWNQADAIREWVMYHSWLGIERWFIYDNNSDDGTSEIVQELVNENFTMSRHAWPWIKTQEAGFSHCALRAKRECEWVSFMDIDEYFYFPYNTHGPENFRTLGYAAKDSLQRLVRNISITSSSIADIRTSCHSFGPSGLGSRPNRGVVLGYTCRVQSPERHKSIIKPDALDPNMLNVVHHFRLVRGYEYLNLPQNVMVINHYKYQVWDVFKAKFRRRVATYVADWRENQNEGSRDRAPGLGTEAVKPLDWSRRFCEVWDTGLRDFVLTNMADVATGLLPWEGGSGLID